MNTGSYIENFEVLTESDVIVCGGGPAGLGAALAAARCGARVVLIEQTGTLGGMASIGLVPCFAHIHDGENPVAAGICMELVEECCKRMGIEKPQNCWQPINAEIFKQVCDEKIQEAGIELYLGQKMAAVHSSEGHISSVAVAGPQGLKQIKGKVFVDGSGDAAVAAFAGAKFMVGDKDGKTMSPSLCVQYSRVNWNEYKESRVNCRSIWKKLLDEGSAPLKEHHLVGAFQTGRDVATGNLGHTYGINAIDEKDLSTAYLEGRRIARVIHDFFREYVPGFAQSELVNTASLLSVRETRRICGDYCLNYDDYLTRAAFPDDIARYCYPIDIHSSSLDAEEQKNVEKQLNASRYQPGETYGIPYRALLPQGLDNLLVAGRSISSDREMQSSVRVMPSCFLTGQAAGAAAALSLPSGGITRKVNIQQLQDTLREKVGAFLP